MLLPKSSLTKHTTAHCIQYATRCDMQQVAAVIFMKFWREEAIERARSISPLVLFHTVDHFYEASGISMTR